MSRNDIIRMARKAGFVLYDLHDIDGQDLGESVEADDFGALERFAALVSDAKGEACAKVCDALANGTIAAQSGPPDALGNVMLRQVAVLVHSECATAIRVMDKP